MSNKLVNVFVYGTLKKNNSNYKRFLTKATFLGVAETTTSNYAMYCNGYFPYVSELSPEVVGTSIKGELFQVNKATLMRLDSLEGYNPNSSDNHYDRKLINVVDSNGVVIQAFIYVVGNTVGLSQYKVIPDGTWIAPVRPSYSY